MDYNTIRLMHQGAVTVSVTGFAVRATAALRGARWLYRRDIRTAVQSVDTLLLVLGLTLAWELRRNPLTTPWLQAKLAGLVCYIVCGTLALRPGRSQAGRAAAAVAALVSVGWIISVAIARNPAGFLARS